MLLHRVLFFAEIAEFQKIVGSLIELVDQLAKAAESEKMKVCGADHTLQHQQTLLSVSNRPVCDTDVWRTRTGAPRVPRYSCV